VGFLAEGSRGCVAQVSIEAGQRFLDLTEARFLAGVRLHRHVVPLAVQEVIAEVRRLYFGAVVERALAALDCRIEVEQPHYGGEAPAFAQRPARDGAILTRVQLETGVLRQWDDRGRVEIDVIPEVATHDVVIVADAALHDLVRREQQARVFDAADREDVRARLDRETVAAERGDVQARNRLTVRVRANARDVGVEVQADVRRLHDRVPVTHAEAGRRTELNQAGAHVVAQRQRRRLRQVPLIRLVVGRPDLTELLSVLVILRDLGMRDRPAAVRHPGSCLEVDRIESAAESAPVTRRTAEEAQPADFEREGRQADDFAAGQSLGLRIWIEAAAFEDQHRHGAAGQLERHRDAGRAGADYAKIGREFGITRYGTAVEMHGSMKPCRNYSQMMRPAASDAS